MSQGWARAILTAYRWTGALAYPFIGGYVAFRAAKGKEESARRGERYGRTNVERPEGPLVWVHAASVGETSAVIPLIERITSYGIWVVLTTGTVTSARLADERLKGRVIHQYVPLDLKPAVSRFLGFWMPDLAVIAESEIWPMTILELGARRVPQVLVNGRLSDRSFAAWKRRPTLAEALFENLAHVVAQSESDAERFRALGARPVTVAGNLKVDTRVPPADQRLVGELRAAIGFRKTWAAISTHEGEEEIACRVHKALARKHPEMLTIIVPRHPERAPALQAMMEARGLKVVTKSSGKAIRHDTDIFLGDTIGDMGLYLRLTEIAYVGRSLVAEGGQNPLEPAMLGTAILSGRHVQNFRDAYQRLVKNGGARLVRDPKMLAGAVDFLIEHPSVRKGMMEAAARTIEDMRGALDRTMATLDPYIHPLVLKARLVEREKRF